MKISIITATFNSESTVEDTLQSVINQTHPDIEHIIIDGKSTDKTLTIINKYRQHVSQLISEPDKGIYDAMNKGLQLATGDIIGFLNSDDVFENNGVLSRIASCFEDETIDGCHADIVYVAQDDLNEPRRYWQSSNYQTGDLNRGWIPAHPTFYLRKKIYQLAGEYSLNYRLASDYEFMLRVISKYNIKTTYIPEVMVKMRLGGATNQSLKNIIKQNVEIVRALKHYKISNFPLLYFCHKFIDRAKQYGNRNQYRG